MFLLTFSVLSTNAHATLARLLALGMDEVDNEGSYYISDDRNMFLNASTIHDFKDRVILEWGHEGQRFSSSGTANATVDKDYDPKASGGFIRGTGDYVYGVYVGNESNTSSLLRIVSSSAVAAYGTVGTDGELLNSADNQIDLFFGGGRDVKWAGNFLYTKSENETQSAEDSGHAVRLGATTDQWNAFLNLGIGSKSKKTVAASAMALSTVDVTEEYKGKLGIHGGGGFKIGDGGTIFGYYKVFNWEQSDSLGPVTGLSRGKLGSTDGGFTSYTLGYGHEMKVGQGTIFSSVSVRNIDVELEFSQKVEVKNFWIPLTVAYEGKATDWLTFRGSVTQNLYGYRENKNYAQLNTVGQSLAVVQFGADTNGKKQDMANSTDVRAGASLVFGDVSIDGLIGTTLSPTSNPTSVSENGDLRVDNLFTRVGMVYKF